MKKLFLALAFVLGTASAHAAVTLPSSTAPVTSDAHCQYKLADARAGLGNLKVAGFVTQQKSADGARVVGYFAYHDPANPKADSVDAIAFVLVDVPSNRELTLLVAYVKGAEKVVYKREVRREVEKQPDGTLKVKEALGPCFERITDKISQ